MAVNDVKVIKNPAGYNLTFDSQDRTTSSETVAYEPGEPLKKASTGFVEALDTGDPEIGTDAMIGICHTKSTETSTADGEVEIEVCMPGCMLRADATTATNIDTAAELLAYKNLAVTFDLTGAGTNGPTGVFTIDEDETDDPNVHGLIIHDGDIDDGTLDVFVNVMATLFGQYI